MVAKLFLLQFYLFGCVIVRLRKMLFAVAGLRPQNILFVFLASLENLKFRYEIVLQPSLNIYEDYNQYPQYSSAVGMGGGEALMKATAAVAPDIQAGEQEIIANVTLVYRVK